MQIQAIPFLTEALPPQNNKQPPGKTGFPPSPFLALLAGMLQQADALPNGLVTMTEASPGENESIPELDMRNSDEEQGTENISALQALPLFAPSVPGNVLTVSGQELATETDSTIQEQSLIVQVVSGDVLPVSGEEQVSDLQVPPLCALAVPIVSTTHTQETEQVPQVNVVTGNSPVPSELPEPLQQQIVSQAVAVDEETEGTADQPERKATVKTNEAGKSAQHFPPEVERPIQAEGRGHSLRFQNEQVKEQQSRDKTEYPALDKAAFPTRAALETPAALYGKVNVERAAVLEQVLEKMVLNKDGNGESRIFIRLRPAALGEVEIRLRMENGQLNGNILTQNAQVKEVLETALAQLKLRLEAQQIQVAELTVTVGQDQGFHQGRGFTGMPWEHGMTKKFGVPAAELDESTLPAGILHGLIDARA